MTEKYLLGLPKNEKIYTLHILVGDMQGAVTFNLSLSVMR